MSIQRSASTSVTRPKYTWVVRRFWCRNNTFETISSGTPVRLANVAEEGMKLASVTLALPADGARKKCRKTNVRVFRRQRY